MRIVAWVVVGLVVLGMVFGGSDDPQGRPGEGADDRETGTSQAGQADPSGADAASAETPRPRTYLVTWVADGDTLRLGNGETVRLVGIDAPERGACGSVKAADNLRRLVLGKRVRLAAPVRDRDRYGRLLRYVDVGDQDAGLRLIKNGLAVARYDSRDGYDAHPRERSYVAADKATPNLTCPKPAEIVPFAGGGACAPGYQPCVPPYPPDVDCADVDGPIDVTGADPHGLDADGVACE